MKNSRTNENGDGQANFFDYLLVGLPEGTIIEVKQLFYNFITNVMTYDEVKSAYQSLIGNTDAINMLQSFMNVSEEAPVVEQDENDTANMKKNKTWSRFEDQRLVTGIHKYGITNWTNICQFVGNRRTRGQCSQRWHRTINPLINKNYWSAEEDYKLIHAVNKYGDKSWAKVASYVIDRTDIQCRYRYQIISKKRTASSNESPTLYYYQNSEKISGKSEKPRKAAEVTPKEDNQSNFKTTNLDNAINLFDLLKEISADPSSLFNNV